MLKILGCVIVLTSSGLLGIKKYGELSGRKKTLCAIYSGAIKIKNNLSSVCMPLYECFLSGGAFFEAAAKNMQTGSSPGEAVKAAAENFPLAECDRECVARFASGLSAQDCAGQIANTDIFIKELEKNISLAAGELDTRGKLYVKGSILSAAAIVLLLI